MSTEVVTVRVAAERALEHARRIEREAIAIQADLEELIEWLSQNPHWDVVTEDQVTERIIDTPSAP